MFDFIVDVLEVTIGVVIADQLNKHAPAIKTKVEQVVNKVAPERYHTKEAQA